MESKLCYFSTAESWLIYKPALWSSKGIFSIYFTSFFLKASSLFHPLPPCVFWSSTPSCSSSYQKKLFCTAESSSETLRQKKVGKWTPVWPAEAWRSAICHHGWVAVAATFRTYASKPWVSGLKESRRKPAEVPPQGWGTKPGGSAEEELTVSFSPVRPTKVRGTRARRQRRKRAWQRLFSVSVGASGVLLNKKLTEGKKSETLLSIFVSLSYVAECEGGAVAKAMGLFVAVTKRVLLYCLWAAWPVVLVW